MLTNEQITHKLEGQKAEIIRQTAETVLKSKLSFYANLPQAKLEQLFTPTIEMVLEYFRTNDTTELKATMDTRVSAAVKRGQDLKEIIKVNEIIAQILNQMIESVTSSDSTARAKYLNRVENLKALANISAMNGKIKENK